MKRKVNGAAVAALREAVGISQVELARRVEISATHLNRIESGEREASPTLIRKLADTLGVSLDAITHLVSAAAA